MRQVASGLPVQLESLAWPVPSAQRGQQGPLDRKARQGQLVLLVPQGQPARRGRRVPAEQRETQG